MIHPIASEPKAPPEELQLFLETLPRAVARAIQTTGKPVTFAGLPIEEWAGPGYAVGAMFDPAVLTAEIAPTTVYLSPQAYDQQGVTHPSQKEYITLVNLDRQKRQYRLPDIWGGVPYQRLQLDGSWQVLAHVAEHPALAVQPGRAVFAFDPLRVIHRYLSSADPRITWDFTDLIIQAILGRPADLIAGDHHDLRRDFHAFGINLMLLLQMAEAAGKTLDVTLTVEQVTAAARTFLQKDYAAAQTMLTAQFSELARFRRMLAGKAVYFMNLPHGGILFENEGYAEYDSPSEAAQVLNLFLDWSDRFGYHFAPDIGAGTLREFQKIYPQTVKRLKNAWDEGRIEMVNGSFSQPYLQLFPVWDQERQFARGQEIMTELFGRSCTVYAAQEIALHPALPDLLANARYAYAIHRCANLGQAPLDEAAIIDWTGPQGGVIRALPAHPLRSERRNAEIYRHLPILLTSKRNDNIPWVVFTNFMDQSFIDIYVEEVVRSNRYAPVWGKFVTPTEFFEETQAVPAVPRRYHLDDYYYHLTLNSEFHHHQVGGYSSEQAFLFAQSRALRQNGGDPAQLDELLNQQAHDCYIIPYFTTGYFMETAFSDYSGPRTRCENDQPRGAGRFIRDAAKYPCVWYDRPEETAAPAAFDGVVFSSNNAAVKIDLTSGKVLEINGVKVCLGEISGNGGKLVTSVSRFDDNCLVLNGAVAGFGSLQITYFFGKDNLYAVIEATTQHHLWQGGATDWRDCIRLSHGKAARDPVLRHLSGVAEPTKLDYFHSLDALTVGKHTLCHGGNIFFRQSADRVENRLWCYGEFCRSFWWGIKL